MKPRIFVSSTYYDLKHIRSSLENFVIQLGYEPILFENGDVPFHPDRPLDESCYDAVDHAQIFVLILGGRYGSAASGQVRKPKDGKIQTNLEKMYDFYNSVTIEEYKRARKNETPIYIFVEKGVAAEYQTYKENRDNESIKYAHVDNVSIFKVLDAIFAESTNNLVREFETFTDISTWLRDQWAGLFSDFLSKRKTDAVLTDLSSQVVNLSQVVDALKSYSEAIVRRVEPDNETSSDLIAAVERRLAIQIVNGNPLIRHLSKKKPGIAWSTEELLNKVIGSNSVDEFARSLGFDNEFIDGLLTKSPAAKDFDQIKKQLSELTQLPEFVSATPETPSRTTPMAKQRRSRKSKGV